jgi:hypothetical protein
MTALEVVEAYLVARRALGGIAPIRGIPTARATAGMSIGPHYCRRRCGRSSGSGARCSHCISRPDVEGTSPLNAMRQRLAGAKARLRGAADIDFQIKTLLDKHHVNRYLKVSRVVREEHFYKQTRRGRPGRDTAYRKITKRRFDIEWTTDEEAIAYDHNSDGMYPLITNDRSLSPAQVLEAHKGQPMIAKRFEQIKTVHEIAPVFLKNEGRIKALFTLYFLALLCAHRA